MRSLGPATRASRRVRRAWTFARIWGVVALAVCIGRPAHAQEAPPKIGPYALDLHLVLPQFPDDSQLADSRALKTAELPGAGMGASASLHVYLPKIFGI